VRSLSPIKQSAAALFLLLMLSAVSLSQPLNKFAGPNSQPQNLKQERSIKILSTPEPEIPPEIVTDIELTVTLLATFKKNGKVSDVKVVSSQVPAFIRGAILSRLETATVDAAKKIQFTPAMSSNRKFSQRAYLIFTYKREKKKKYLNWQPGLVAE